MKQALKGAEPPARVSLFYSEDGIVDVHEVVAENAYAIALASVAATLDATAQDALDWLEDVMKRKGTKRGGKGC